MTRMELGAAITEITKNGKTTAEERRILGNFIWEAIDKRLIGDFTRARAVIDFLHQTGKISLTEAFNLADLL